MENNLSNDGIAEDLSTIEEGNTIKPERKFEHIIDQSEKAIVFLDDKNEIGYKYIKEKVAADLDSKFVLEQFDFLKSKITYRYSGKQRSKLLEKLGKCLYDALMAEKNRPNFFVSIENEIRGTLSSEEQRSKFIASSIFWTLLFSIVLFVIYLIIVNYKSYINLFQNVELINNPRIITSIFCCLIGGCIGACFSVITRKDINIPYKIGFFNSQIFVHCFYGMISGVVLYTIVAADLVMGFVVDKYTQLFIFSFISGFSERLIPTMISKLENETIKKQQ